MGKVLLRFLLISLFLSFLAWDSFAGGGNLVKHIRGGKHVKAGLSKHIAPGDNISTPNGALGICPGGNMTLTANVAAPVTSYQWTKNGADISPGGTSSTYTASNPGTYNVKVTTAAEGTFLLNDVTLVAGTTPVATFIFDNNNSCSGTTITYTSNITGGTAPFTYNWNFGDGATSTLSNPTHIYTAVGCGTSSFTTTLIVTDANGCSSAQVSHGLIVIQAPDVQLMDINTFNPFSNCQNNPTLANPSYTLKVNNTSPSTACISSYTIDWGDGGGPTAVSAGSFPLTHVYNQLGAFNLVISAIGTNGCHNSKTYLVANQSNPAGGLGTLGNTSGLCAPAQVPFIISNWQSNSPGTTYVLDFGDGTSMTLSHPLNPGLTPDTIYHTYTKSSCPSASFTATLRVSNACASTPYTAGNIQIQTKPTASFTPISGCDGQPICFTNTTAPGSYGASCSAATNYSWDFGEPASGANNTSTSSSPCHTYAGPGTYTVTLTASNPCGPTAISYPVTVYPLPTMTSPNTATICSGGTINIPLTSSIPSNFKWVAANNPNTTGESTTVQTTSTINNTIINSSFTAPQTVVYTVTPTAIATGCVGPSQTVNVTVNPKPNVPSVTTIFNYCLNDPAPQLSATAISPNTLTWYDPGTTFTHTGATATAPTPSTSVAGVTKYWVTQTNPTGCESLPSSITVTVYPLIANNTITSDQTICSGTSPTALTGTTPTGGSGSYTYQWQFSTDGTTFNNITTATSINYSPGALAANTFYRRIVNSSTCNSQSNIITINVQASLSSFGISSDQTICNGITPALLSGQSPAGGSGTFTYQWQSSTNGITFTNITSEVNKDYQPSALNATTYYRRQVFAGCNATSNIVTITVNPVATVNAIADKSYCNGSSATAVTFSANTTAANTTYAWTNDNTAIGLSLPSGTGNLPNFTTTNSTKAPITAKITVTPTYTGGAISCAGTPLTFKINVLPTITLAANTNSAYCAGATVPAFLPVNDAAVFAGSSINYTWTVSSAIGLSAGTGAQVPSFTAVNNGTVDMVCNISVTPNYTYNGQTCSGTPMSYSVTVSPKPSTSVAGPNDKTCNTSYQLAGNTPTVGTGLWTVSTGPSVTFNSPNAGNSTATGLAKGTRYGFTWTISNSTCTSSASTVTVDVLSDIVNTITSDVTTNCPGQPVHFSTATLSGGDVPATLAASYTYVWESSTNNITWAVISGATSATLLANPSVNTYYRRTVSSYNKCPVISNVIQITMNSVAPAAVAGSPITLCSQTQTVLAGNNPGVFAGTWTDSAPGSTLVFTPDAHTYNATVSGLVPGTTYHLVWSIASPSCGATTSNLTITDLAPITNTISPASTTVCAGQAVTLTGSISTGGTGSFTYSWESSPDQITWTAISGQTGQNITFTPVATGYIRRNVTSGICNLESSAVSVTVQQGIANNTISANQQVCIGFPVSALTGSTPTGGDNIYAYQWQQSTDQITWTDIPSANQIGYQPPSAPNMTVYYRRIVSTALCTGPQKNASNAVKIAINPIAIADFIATTQNGCIPFNLGSVITSTPHNAVDASYQWFANGVSIGTGSAFPGYTMAIDGQTVVIKLLVTSSFGCDTVSKSLTFTTVKKVTASYTKDQIKGCGPLLVHFTNTSTPLASATYAWDFGNGQTSTLVQPNPITFQAHPLNRDTTYKIKLTATTGCSVTTYIDSVTVRPKPRAIFTPDKTIGCSPFTVNLTNQSRGAPNTYTFDFGDGNTQVVTTNQAISHTYNVIKTDTVTLKLTAQNECGVDTTSYKIVIYPNLVSANFVVNGNNKAGCAPYTVKFDNNTTGANTYNYDFGDGTTAIGATSPESVLHTYTQPGTYTATFSASNGCSTATATQTITVIAAPRVKFAPTPLQSCVKDSVSFINQTTPIASYSYIWDFGDGTTGNQLNPKHVYTNPGTYTVRLTASQSAAGATCGSSVTHIVNIVSIPVASFTSNSGGVNCAPYLLTVATTPANAFAFSWTFTDQSGTTTASGPAAQHLYTQAGLYTVKLTSFNQSGCADSITQIVKITETPKAIFTPGDSIICGNSATITFKNGSTYGGADPLTYRWFINNTQVATSKNLTYAFNPAAGTLPVVYQVKLITSSTVGCPDTVIHNMHFNPIPVATYTVTSKVGCVPFTPSITNSTIYADQYKWYLNNQLVSTVKTPPHIVLSQPNAAYTLKLVASNSLGCRSDSITLGLNTYPKPKASYTIQDTVSCNGALAINVTNTSVGAVAYIWNFGDGSPNSTAVKPTYTYSTPGVYKLMLIATNNTSCPDTVTHLIEIANPPKATFTANQVSGCTLISPTFQNASINASSYLWDFGDGTTSTQKNPTHSFNYVNSPYTITLTVTGEYGCTDKSILTNYISVAAPPIADFSVSPDTIIKIPNHTFNFTDLTPGTITKYAWDFGDGKISVDKDPSHTYADIGTYKVSLTVTNSDGCQHTRVHTVKIIPVPQYLYVPNAFEPGSSKSELKTFNVRATGLLEYNLRIFNKMGQMLFQTTTIDSNGVPMQGWDGTADGKPVPQDVYIWDISARFLDGTSWTGMNYNDGRATTRTGIIHLVR